MAIVGMAFGLGFLCGPAIGGLLALIDVSDPNTAPAFLGLNPFSVPAAFATGLALLNLVLVRVRLRETLPAAMRGKVAYRTLNPLAVFGLRAYVGASRVVVTNFFYVTIFSGMEFTLVFLAAERLQYGNAERGLLFVFVGVIIALVQGGYVRRRARSVGEKRMALRGMALTIPGLLLLGFADSTALLLAGLAFLAVGSAMVMPCLTALVSLVAPSHDQGRVVGIFRSLGSLGRAVGPIIAGFLYWKCGATWAYAIGGALLIIPVVVGFGLPPDRAHGESSDSRPDS
jgi:MFS family permease